MTRLNICDSCESIVLALQYWSAHCSEGQIAEEDALNSLPSAFLLVLPDPWTIWLWCVQVLAPTQVWLRDIIG